MQGYILRKHVQVKWLYNDESATEHFENGFLIKTRENLKVLYIQASKKSTFIKQKNQFNVLKNFISR